MNSNLDHILNEHFSDILQKEIPNDNFSLYRILNQLTNYCAENIDSSKTIEILNVVNYNFNLNLIYDCNAIENEFLFVLANRLGISELMNNLKILPEQLWTSYIKMLLETQKY